MGQFPSFLTEILPRAVEEGQRNRCDEEGAKEMTEDKMDLWTLKEVMAVRVVVLHFHSGSSFWF